MAAAQRVDVNICTPEGYEYVDRTYRESPLLEAVTKGDELKLTSTGWRKRHAGERANGVAPRNGRAGEVGFPIHLMGEADGYTGLTPGVALFPDAGVNGGLNDTVVANFIPQVLAVRPSRIRFDYRIG